VVTQGAYQPHLSPYSPATPFRAWLTHFEVFFRQSLFSSQLSFVFSEQSRLCFHLERLCFQVLQKLCIFPETFHLNYQSSIVDQSSRTIGPYCQVQCQHTTMIAYGTVLLSSSISPNQTLIFYSQLPTTSEDDFDPLNRNHLYYTGLSSATPPSFRSVAVLQANLPHHNDESPATSMSQRKGQEVGHPSMSIFAPSHSATDLDLEVAREDTVARLMDRI
jgi:hypothetical protein